ncbi:hypothetical protein Kpol_538p6 [Vanderwaltozyma polyspora DSM 70294]|uniref:ADF-H domain-containing protein n=1 Tax=Vanderwaltozyma polyspora (strain ATCC 22028 / DSM 70294 / BCRC 21397 / CBS 2163 / NBRC 10782 / NRRL Y-8283 / UCD 57-17) TaxID=436907 RepID=A7TKB9_VANPO|nr:uncharacterized protein Kpol_538p6 [Vanderwaltozyma polyspora DSM 70294]EDO17246.1 hypothetical protein Kpol_538p6 [Vanderwaltozyma polyspora DSM 70294]
MSNQSGIVAEQQLVDNLRNAEVGSKGIVIITGEISDDFTSVLYKAKYNSIEELKSNLGKEPLYVFIKDSSSSAPDQYNFISFVPDDSHVRYKMLYASTKNTLVRQIGTNDINKQVLFTVPEEFDDNLNDSEEIKSTLLSESERSNIEVEEQHRSMRLSQFAKNHKLVSQTDGVPASLAFDVVTGGSSISDSLNTNNVIQFTIDGQNENVQIINKETISRPEDLKIIQEHPSYTIFKNGDMLYFIYSCPSGSKVKERMLYASNKTGFINHLKDSESINFANVLEIGDPEELEISLISSKNEEEADAKVDSGSSAQRFSKPKGPMRRKRA